MGVFLASVIWAFQYLVLFLCQSMFLKPKFTRMKFVVYCFGYFLLCCLMKSFLLYLNVDVSIIALFTITIAALMAYFIFFHGTKRLLISSNLLCFVITTELEISALYIKLVVGDSMLIKDLGSIEYFVHVAIMNIYFVCTLIPAYLILKKINIKKWKGYHGMYWFMPISHICLIMYLQLNMWYKGYDLSLLLFWGSLFMFIGNYLVIWGQIRGETLIEREMAKKRQLFHERVELVRRKHDSASSPAVGKIRHDINNKLTSAVYLLEHEKFDEAQVLLEELEDILEG